MPNVSFTYNQSAEEVFKFVTDPDQVRARCEAFGETDIVIDVSNAGGTKVVSTTRMVETDLPKIAKKFFKAKNKVLDRKEWRDAGDKKTAKLHVDTIGAPAQMNGDITITPDGDGCRYSVEFTASVKVPLIGKKIEAIVGGIMKKEIEREFKYNQAKLNEA